MPEFLVALAGRGTMQEGTGGCGSCPLPVVFSKSSQSTANFILLWKHTFPTAYTWLFWQQALSQSCHRGSGSGELWVPGHSTALCVCDHTVLAVPADIPHTLCKDHTCTGVHTASTSLVPVLVGCRQAESPRMEGTKAQRVCAPAACGWSPVITLSCLLVLPGPMRTASWRIWTRLG